MKLSFLISSKIPPANDASRLENVGRGIILLENKMFSNNKIFQKAGDLLITHLTRLRRVSLSVITKRYPSSDMDLEDVMVTGIEENIRGPEHFNENFFVVREASGLYLSADSKQ